MKLDQAYFDAVIDRAGTACEKWDGRQTVFGREDVIPLWVADMDFACSPAIVEALKTRAAHPIYGYTQDDAENRRAEVNFLKRRFDLTVDCKGDSQVDFHHTTEDVGIALGQAFARALGEMRGICRYGSFYLPMDEALVLCAVDLSGRCTLNWDIRCQTEKVGDFDVECAKEFWYGFARSVPATVHFVQFAGENTHHILEACFKGAGHALAEAVRIDAAHRDEIPSTKGLLV